MVRRIMKASSFLLCLLATTTTTLFSPSIGGDTITPRQPLGDDGGTLISAGGSFELGFFSPDGSNNDNRYIGIWYHNISARTVVWVANRQRPLSGRSGRLLIESNGTLVITDENSTTIWSSTSPALVNPVARILDNGNFVVREAAGNDDDPSSSSSSSFAWQSFHFPTDTLLPGMKMGWNLTSRLNRNLTAWRSASDPSPSNYVTGLDVRGDPQLFIWSGTQPTSRAGPWNGLRYSGFPEMEPHGIFSFHFTVDPQEIVYSFYMQDHSIISRLTMNSSGILQRVVWMEERKLWSVYWITPKDQCDKMSPCGPYGVCYPNGLHLCDCLQGFRPRNPANWDLRDGTDGCVRETALDCRNGTDGFVIVSNAKLPDTSRSTVDWSMSLELCRDLCLRNCSCTGYARANISGSGSGCIIWTTELTDIKIFDSRGQDLYVRLAAADLGSESNHSLPDSESIHSHRSHLVVIIVVPAAFAICLLACVACCVWRRKKKTSRFIDEETGGKDLDLPLYDLSTVMDATDNFSIENKLGEGGFGPVYKGKLGDEQEIAVKRLSTTSAQGLDEFQNEVMLIAKLQHRNLVRLLGCCIQGGERMLIYEYMPNRSLDAFLFDEAKGALLDWRTRYNIIVGIARGLLYLHHDSRFRIIHRDLKASNILLDKDMNPKISDFGMARIFGGDESEAKTKRVVGTYGYMSPEYAMDGNFSVKSDVFSFGVLVLEIISGKKNRGVYQSSRHQNLLGHIWSIWKQNKGLELVDGSIGHLSPICMAEVLRCIKVGLLCVQERPEDRPIMSSVVVMLGGDTVLLPPEPKQPGFIITTDSSKKDSFSSKHDSLSINQVSITIVEGR